MHRDQTSPFKGRRPPVAKRAMHHIAFRGFVANRLINRWNQLDKRVVDASRINAFKGWMNKTRETRMGFFVD